MNLSVLQAMPSHTVSFATPKLMSPTGNIYKMKMSHYGVDSSHVRDYEVWATKEAIQKHFNGTAEEPNKYQLKKFARQMYDSRLKATGGAPKENAMFMSSSQSVHGDPRMWPHAIIDPEMKI